MAVIIQYGCYIYNKNRLNVLYRACTIIKHVCPKLENAISKYVICDFAVILIYFINNQFIRGMPITTYESEFCFLAFR
jgi:hypothetical protein